MCHVEAMSADPAERHTMLKLRFSCNIDVSGMMCTKGLVQPAFWGDVRQFGDCLGNSENLLNKFGSDLVQQQFVKKM